MKHSGYGKIKILIEQGHTTEIGQIVEDVPKKTLYTDLKMGFQAFDKRLANPDLFRISEIRRLAALIGVDPIVIAALVLEKPLKKKP